MVDKKGDTGECRRDELMALGMLLHLSIAEVQKLQSITILPPSCPCLTLPSYPLTPPQSPLDRSRHILKQKVTRLTNRFFRLKSGLACLFFLGVFFFGR